MTLSLAPGKARMTISGRGYSTRQGYEGGVYTGAGSGPDSGPEISDLEFIGNQTVFSALESVSFGEGRNGGKVVDGNDADYSSRCTFWLGRAIGVGGAMMYWPIIGYMPDALGDGAGIIEARYRGEVVGTVNVTVGQVGLASAAITAQKIIDYQPGDALDVKSYLLDAANASALRRAIVTLTWEDGSSEDYYPSFLQPPEGTLPVGFYALTPVGESTPQTVMPIISITPAPASITPPLQDYVHLDCVVKYPWSADSTGDDVQTVTCSGDVACDVDRAASVTLTGAQTQQGGLSIPQSRVTNNALGTLGARITYASGRYTDISFLDYESNDLYTDKELLDVWVRVTAASGNWYYPALPYDNAWAMYARVTSTLDHAGHEAANPGSRPLFVVYCRNSNWLGRVAARSTRPYMCYPSYASPPYPTGWEFAVNAYTAKAQTYESPGVTASRAIAFNDVG